MTFENILLTRQDGISTITFNRPEAFNAMNAGLGSDLVKALEICADDEQTKVIVITGAGKAFCAGGDLAMFKNADNMSDTIRQLIKVSNIGILAIRRTPKPVIASINGAIGGAGMSIAAACDLRLCAASAKFKQGFVSAGLVPDSGRTALVPALVGFSKASEIALLDPLFDAEEALRINFVNKVFNDDDLAQETAKIATKLANGPSVAYGIVKTNLNHALFHHLEYQLEIERTGMTNVAKTKDAKEGIASFLEKRKPQFKGE
jgi:2-(1,2-epoxy-1,2-dihydrophenyl)acetyl-CoA isomerase